MPEGWVVARLRGVPIVLAPSWLLIAVALGIVVAPTFAQVLPAASVATVGLTAALVPIMLLLSVLAHEIGHGLAGHAVGVPPQRYVLTLWGGHTQFHEAMRTPGAAALVALAGPAANVLIALVTWLALVVGPAPREAPVVFLLLQVAMVSNAIVAGFNLLPGLPMDGGQALEALIWRVTGNRERGMLIAGWGGRAVVVGLVALTLVWPVTQGAQPRIFTVVWVVLLGAYLWAGASRSIATVYARRQVADLDLRTLAEPVIVLPRETSIAEAPSHASYIALLDTEGQPLLLVDSRARRMVPPEAWPTTALAAIAEAVPPQAVISQWHGPRGVAEAARAARFSHLIVLSEHGRPIGVLPVPRLEQALRRRARA